MAKTVSYPTRVIGPALAPSADYRDDVPRYRAKVFVTVPGLGELEEGEYIAYEPEEALAKAERRARIIRGGVRS